MSDKSVEEQFRDRYLKAERMVNMAGVKSSNPVARMFLVTEAMRQMRIQEEQDSFFNRLDDVIGNYFEVSDAPKPQSIKVKKSEKK